MSKNSKTIPEWVIRDEDKKTFLGRFNMALSGCNKSYKELMGFNDLELPRDPKALSEDDVNKHIDERINELTRTKILTHETKERVKKEWEEIRSKAIGCILKIHQFSELYPDAELNLNDDSVVCCNTEMLLYERCKVKTPEIVFRHFDLIKKVEEAIKDLQEFEYKNDYPTGDLMNVDMDIKMAQNPQWLIENWLHQTERKKFFEKHSNMVASMEMQERKERAMNEARLKEKSEQYQREHPDDYTLSHKSPQPANNEYSQGTVSIL